MGEYAKLQLLGRALKTRRQVNRSTNIQRTSLQAKIQEAHVEKIGGGGYVLELWYGEIL